MRVVIQVGPYIEEALDIGVGYRRFLAWYLTPEGVNRATVVLTDEQLEELGA